ncbi:hypothetical protein D9611_005382 [Ephemerocybe angulata]|uniref:Uncharacterized protein n=1 Tax=Ephemerocybe angulata TaxID=980116 RepID=A0A8H5FDN6_9AGAR|nr:hypothetical protein D9611_005382 [Tulosesus angulatus]
MYDLLLPPRRRHIGFFTDYASSSPGIFKCGRQRDSEGEGELGKKSVFVKPTRLTIQLDLVLLTSRCFAVLVAGNRPMFQKSTIIYPTPVHPFVKLWLWVVKFFSAAPTGSQGRFVGGGVVHTIIYPSLTMNDFFVRGCRWGDERRSWRLYEPRTIAHRMTKRRAPSMVLVVLAVRPPTRPCRIAVRWDWVSSGKLNAPTKRRLPKPSTASFDQPNSRKHECAPVACRRRRTLVAGRPQTDIGKSKDGQEQSRTRLAASDLAGNASIAPLKTGS